MPQDFRCTDEERVKTLKGEDSKLLVRWGEMANLMKRVPKQRQVSAWDQVIEKMQQNSLRWSRPRDLGRHGCTRLLGNHLENKQGQEQLFKVVER